MSKPIDILLGVDVYHDIIKTGVILGSRNTPAAQETIFGWVLFGSTTTVTPLPQTIDTFHTLAESPTCEQLLSKFWSLEEVPDNAPSLSLKDKAVIQEFKYTVSRDSQTGRYTVRLPMKRNAPILGESRPQALRRFLSLERRLHRSKQFDNYAKVVNEYFTSQHAEPVPIDELDKDPSKCFYLAYHAVYKDSETTPLRVVFDGSMKSTSGSSINDLLVVGPTVHPPLNDDMMRFRLHPYALTTDISKMYRAVGLPPEDRDFHRFLWRNSPTDPITEYRMTRVTFGIARSAFLATNTIHHHADQHKDEYQLANASVKDSFYVDDGLFSVATKEEAISLYSELDDLSTKGGFKLHKWNSNTQEVLDTIPVESRSLDQQARIGESETFVKTLGIEYNANQDHFKFSAADSIPDTTNLTKRIMLSDSLKIFDPLGLISCVTIVVKIHFQRLWEQGVQWDDPLPPDIEQDWLAWRKGLHQISSLRIPRCYAPLKAEIISKQLVGFSDASEKAYCGIVYLRSLHTAGGVHLSIVIAKTKVAPLKKVSLPRLELCGALLLARLLKHAKMSLTYLPATSVPSQTVPCDLWWHGPPWLKNDETTWPNNPNLRPTSESLMASGYDESTLQVKTEKAVNAHVVSTHAPVIDLETFSSYTKLIRTTARVFRVVKRENLYKNLPLTVEEIQRAEQYLIKESQRKYFPQVIQQLTDKKPLLKSNQLQPLNPFLDGDGLLRVGGRLSQSSLGYESQHPIIIHSKDRLAELLVDREHRRLCHAGPKLTLRSLQQKYHIVGSGRMVRQHTQTCVICRRAAPTTVSQLTGQVPAARLCPTHVNDKVSVDYAGPLTIKLETKACHIELVSELTAEAFLAALRRFVSRRGKPSQMWSDNGTQFTRTNKDLKELYQALKEQTTQNHIDDWCSTQGIQWHFSPPTGPHHGSVWENGVKACKSHLKRIVGNSKLTFEELTTTLTQIEACLNSTPIVNTIDANDDDGISPLTPGHFVIGRPLGRFPQSLSQVPLSPTSSVGNYAKL